MDRPLQAQQETIRVPVFQEEDYDPFGRNLDQTFINCFPEVIKDPVTGEGEVRVVRRQGFQTTSSDLYSATGAGSRLDLQNKANITVTQLDDVYVAAIGDVTLGKIYIVQYRPLAGTTTLIGTISSVSYLDFVHISECTINSTGVKAGITVVWTKADRSQSKCYWAVSDGTKFTAASLTQIINVAFPDQQTPAQVVTGPMQQMNGIFYAYTTNGTIWNSGSTAGTENDATSWNTLSYILTYQYPDGGVGLYRYKHHLVAFGKNSIEFFNDVGNPPPAGRLERTDQAFIRFGTSSPLFVLNVDDTLYWLSYSDSSTLGLWKLDGYTPVKISSGKQDQRIAAGLGQTSWPLSMTWLFSIVLQNKKHIGLANVFVLTGVISDSGSPANWGQTTDTWYGTSQGTGTDTYAYNLMYNIEDKTWWGLRVSPTLNAMKILPTANYPGYTSGGLPFFIQYILMASATTGGGDGKINTYVYKVGSSEAGSYYDEDLDNLTGLGTAVPFVTVIELNTLSFGNNKRKRITRVEPVFTSIPKRSTSTDLTSNYSFSLAYNKFNLTTGDGLLIRSVDYENAANRYYFNNLGTGRYWNFAFLCNNRDPLSLSAFDITLQQGTH